MPKRIQMSRQRPWRADNRDAVVVSRGPGRPWGNPFEVAPCVDRWRGWRVVSRFADVVGPVFPSKDAATRDAVKRFRQWANRRPASFFEPLRGCDLACWCPLDQPCHGDVLLELANG